MSGFFNYPWRPSESLLFLRSLLYHVTSHYSSTIIVCIPPSDQVTFFSLSVLVSGYFFLGVKSWKERKGKSLHAVVITINCHVSWKIGLLPRFVRTTELHPGNFMIKTLLQDTKCVFIDKDKFFTSARSNGPAWFPWFLLATKCVPRYFH